MKRYYLGLVFFCFSGFALADDQAVLNEEDTSRWTQDIDYYSVTLEAKHIELYHSVDKEGFQNEIAGLKSKLPQLNEYQVKSELTRPVTHAVLIDSPYSETKVNRQAWIPS